MIALDRMSGRPRTSMPRRDPPPLRARGGPDAVRVVLGEGCFLAREGVVGLLDELHGIELVGAYGTLDALRDALAGARPDVVVTDVRMPPNHTDEGIRLARELRSTHPRMGVVVLSLDARPLDAVALFADGAHRRAYVLTERLRGPADLERAVLEVAAGGSFVDPENVDARFSPERGAGRPRSTLARLTARERQILSLVAEGYANGAIAERLGITRRAVERHVNAIFAKLELRESADVSRRVKAALLFLADERRPAEQRS